MEGGVGEKEETHPGLGEQVRFGDAVAESYSVASFIESGWFWFGRSSVGYFKPDKSYEAIDV